MVEDRKCRVQDCLKRAGKRDALCPMHRSRWYRHGTFEKVGRRPVPIEESFEARVVRAEGCWSWTGYRDPLGYPKLRRKSGNIIVHRWVYERYVGELHEGLVIDHACGNTGCLNPDHLRQITPQGNVEHFTTPVRSHNTSGYRGVTFHKPSGLWTANVMAKGVAHRTCHKTIEEAAEGALALRREHHTYNDMDRLGP